MRNTTIQGPLGTAVQPVAVPVKVRYCLYARKSTEEEDKQALSIESQVREMIKLAEQEHLDVVEIKRESHSSKEVGKRAIYNELLAEIREGKFDGILTWAPDRLSRNAGDLGAVVDLLDQGKLIEIRTYTQKFGNNPNDKFMLMILGSQAKLENDQKIINVKRGLRARCEMGYRPSTPPTGYLSEKHVDKRCQVRLDPKRAIVIRSAMRDGADDKHSNGFRSLGSKQRAERSSRSVIYIRCLETLSTTESLNTRQEAVTGIKGSMNPLLPRSCLIRHR